jgi:predicted phosphoribosyltransferase
MRVLFVDRADAGRLLASALMPLKSADPVVLALPRGGVAVAAEVARALSAPLEPMLVRKLGLPSNPELAMGALADGPEPVTVRNEDVIQLAGVSEQVIARVRDRELAELARRRRYYLGARLPTSLADRTVIIVDDGIATGATIRAALRAARRQKPERLILAVPVASSAALDALHEEADQIICLHADAGSASIGENYSSFPQLSDEEVISLLDSCRGTEADASAEPDHGRSGHGRAPTL